MAATLSPPSPALADVEADIKINLGKNCFQQKYFQQISLLESQSYGLQISLLKHEHSGLQIPILKHMGQQGMSVSPDIFLCLLLRCIHDKDLAAGREVDNLIMRNGLGSDAFLGSHLIHMFTLFESLFEANQVFTRLSKPDVFSWNAIILAHAKLGQNEQIIEFYDKMQKSNVKPNEPIFVAVLKACSSVEQGRKVHSHIVEMGLEADSFVGSTLIDMYGKCGSLKEAHFVFEDLPKRTVVTWNALIAGYAQHGFDLQALELYKQMQQEGMTPSRVTFVCILKACSSTALLGEGKRIHAHIIESGLEFGMFVGNTIIDMYAKCRSLEDACRVFDKLSRPDVVSCNVLIAGYAQHGHVQEVLHVFQKMQKDGMEPDTVTFVCSLKACSNFKSLELGRQIHARVIESGFELNEPVLNTVVHMYTQCESLKDACILFARLPNQNVITWSVLIAGYSHNGHCDEALKLFGQMQIKGIQPNKVTFGCILKACSSIPALEQGRLIHTNVVERGNESSLFVGNALVEMYAKCGSLKDASMVFDRLPKRDVVTWSVLIAGYAQNGHGEEALLCFQQMLEEGVEPNPVTFVGILKACSNIAALQQGRWIHAYIIDCGLEADTYVGSTLIDMYIECGHLEDACRIFGRLPRRNVVTWNTLIAGYAQHRKCLEGLQLFRQMQLEGLVEPDSVTFVFFLKACTTTAALKWGRWMHAQIMQTRFSMDVSVGSTLIDMYAKCGCLEDASAVFNSLPGRNVVAWNTLMAGYAQLGHGQEALRLYQQMELECIEPDLVTFLCTLKACSSTAALAQGRSIHAHIIAYGLGLDVFVGNTLIDMYANCGSLHDAHIVFDRLPKQDVVTWSALIAGYSQHCDYSGALKYFEDMQEAGLKPDNVTFLCLLSACSREVLLEEGCLHFRSLREYYGITPTIEHYNSLVDLLGHAGCLNEAEDLLYTVPFERNIIGWTSLLHSCRTFSNIDAGRRCFDYIITIDHGTAAGYVIMSNIYACAGKWKDAREVEELRRHANAWKKPAKAFIEIDSQVHEFVVGDKMHPQSDRIYSKLKALAIQMKNEGYWPCLDVVSNPSSAEKESALCGHSEKLAIAFGLISTSEGTTIRIAKNLRMCGDCHIATRVISRIEVRNIVVKDAYCIHQFQNGVCSCKE